MARLALSRPRPSLAPCGSRLPALPTVQGPSRGCGGAPRPAIWLRSHRWPACVPRGQALRLGRAPARPLATLAALLEAPGDGCRPLTGCTALHFCAACCARWLRSAEISQSAPSGHDGIRRRSTPQGATVLYRSRRQLTRARLALWHQLCGGCGGCWSRPGGGWRSWPRVGQGIVVPTCVRTCVRTSLDTYRRTRLRWWV